MILNKLFDPNDYKEKPFAEMRRYFEAWWNVLQFEGIRFTYSSLNRAWEYGQIFSNVDFRKKRVLDLGTSISLAPIYLMRVLGCDVTTFDKEYRDERITLYAKTACYPINVVVGDMTEPLQFADASFDIVTCFSTIEHIDDKEKAVAEMKRVVKPDGFICLTTDYMPDTPNSTKSGMTFNRQSLDELVKLFGIPLYGDTDYDNVDITKPENLAVQDYTFASMIFKNI